MAGAEGFEPSLTVLETGLLPLTICPYFYQFLSDYIILKIHFQG